MRAEILITLTLTTFATVWACGADHDRARAPAEPTEPLFARTTGQSLTREGEILVVEGGVETVTQTGPGQFGLGQENLEAILSEVYAEVPDAFDTVFVFTTFEDQNRSGVAETFNLNNTVEGIGLEVVNVRESYGLPPAGRLASLSLMNSLGVWGDGAVDGLDDEGSFFYGVLAEELSRRWLFHARFNEITGATSDQLLGRDDRNWSPLAQADGSFLDGIRWVDNGDGTFTDGGRNLGFAPLDLYLMGLRPGVSVGPTFVIENATAMTGDPLDRTSVIPEGATINGDRVDVTFQQILNALGARVPSPLSRPPYDRALFVLVSAPGQSRDDYAADLQVLQSLRARFPPAWTGWTGAALCLKSTERCPEPVVGLADFEFADDNDDLVGPGERTRLTLTLENGGLGTAEDVMVELRPIGAAVMVDTSILAAPPVPSGARVTLETAFDLTVSSTVGCGDRLKFDVVFTTAEGPTFEERFETEVGSREVAFDPLNEDVDWTVDPDGDDTALSGQWALGEPERVVAPLEGDVTQPAEDHSTGESKLAFMTGPSRSRNGSVLFTANDLDGGKTTLESPVFALGGTRDPSLVFYAWRFGRNYLAPGGPVDLEESDLVILVSNDGGATYVELGRFSANTTDWTRVRLRIRDAVEPTNRTRFRFVAEEELPDMPADLLFEVGIDDVQIVDSLEECASGPAPSTDAGVADATTMPTTPDDDDDGGCGCTASAGGPSFVSAALFLLVTAWLTRRRDD